MYRSTNIELNSLDLVRLISVCDDRILGCEFAIATDPHECGRDLAESNRVGWVGTRERLQTALDAIEAEIEADTYARKYATRQDPETMACHCGAIIPNVCVDDRPTCPECGGRLRRIRQVA